MTPKANAGIECRPATGPIAPVGRSRLALLAVAVATIPAIASSSQPAWPASSGSVQISVSVAPRYKVLEVDAPKLARSRLEGYSDRLCLATNSLAPPMPVHLESPSVQRMDVAKAEIGADRPAVMGTLAGVWRCSPIDNRSALGVLNAADRPASRWLLVRPE